MNELFNYIFCGLKESRSDIRSIERNLNRQKWINRNAVISSLAITGCIVLLQMQSMADSKKIDALAKEVEELKNQKGE